MALVNPVSVKFTADTQGLDAGLKKVQSGVSGISKGLAGLGKAALGLAGLSAGIAGLVALADKYRGLRNSVQRTNELFGDSVQYINAFADTALTKFGMATSTVYDFAATYGNLFRGMTKNAKENAKVTLAVMRTTAVIASKTGRTMEDVGDRIRSGILGNVNAIEALGVYTTAAMLKTTDAFKRIADGRPWEKLTYQEQQQIRVLAILEQAQNQYGDSVSHIAGWSLPRLRQALKDMTVYLGMLVNSALQPFLNILGQIVVGVTSAIRALLDLLGVDVAGGVRPAVQGQEALGTAVEESTEALKKQQAALAGFDELNILAEDTASPSQEAGGMGAGSPFDLLADLDEAQQEAVLERAAGRWDKFFQGLATQVGQVFGGLDFAGLATELKPFGETLRDIWENTLLPMGHFLLSDYFTPLAEGFFSTYVPIFSEVLPWAFGEAAKHFQWLGETFDRVWTTILQPGYELIRDTTLDVFGTIGQVWDKYGGVLLDNFSTWMETVREIWNHLWTDILEPIIIPFWEMLKDLWTNHLSGLVHQVGEFVMKLVNGALELYNGFIAPIVHWIIDVFGPAFVNTFLFVKDIVYSVVGAVADILSGVIRVLGGIVDFLVGVFTLNWEKAWEGVKDIFLGIWDAVAGVLKGAINLLIDALNRFIRGLNLISFDVPDWVPLIGGKTFGLNIPEIPKLAEGGIVDRPTLAVVGERGPEAVVPLSDGGALTAIASAVGTAVLQAIQMGSADNTGTTQREAILEVDGVRLARVLLPKMDGELRRLGLRPLTGQGGAY